MSRPEKVQAALRLMGNPYASLSLFDDASEDAAVEPSFEQKRTYFRKLENPHAFSSIFGDAGDDLWQAAAKRNKIGVLEQELDEVLRSYKPHVARTEWKKLMDYRSDFSIRFEQHGVYMNAEPHPALVPEHRFYSVLLLLARGHHRHPRKWN